jgi:glutaredoxin|nr:MAG TPA: NrdH [Caudoviricetes sp.]
MDKMQIISENWCGYCKALKKMMSDKGIQFEEFDMASPTGVRVMTETGADVIPVLFDGKEYHIGKAALKFIRNYEKPSLVSRIINFFKKK